MCEKLFITTVGLRNAMLKEHDPGNCNLVIDSTLPTMTFRAFSVILIAFLTITTTSAQKKKKDKTIIPVDSITGLYAYNGVIKDIEGDIDAIRERLDKWVAQNYSFDTDEHASLKVDEDGDTYRIHARTPMSGGVRRFIEYDLTTDLKDSAYRYKLTNLRYVVVGNYPLEDKRSTDKKRDLEEIDRMMRRILASMKAALADTW